MELDLLTRIQALLALADDPDLTPNQLAGHQMNVIFEIKTLIDAYRKRLNQTKT